MAELPREALEVLEGSRQWWVITGDCLAYLPLLPAASIDHTLEDPPYEKEAHTKQRRLKGKTTGSGADSTSIVESAPLEFDAITPLERAAVGAQVARVTKRWALTFCQVEAAMEWRAALTRTEAHRYVRTCAYVKLDPQPQLTGDRPGMGWESIVVTHPLGRTRWNAGGHCGVFYSLSGKDVDRRDGRNLHSAQKPTDLMRQLVEAFTDVGDLVLDNYGGSGTTGVACLRYHRRVLIFEKDPASADLCRKRLQATVDGLTLYDHPDQLGMLALMTPNSPGTPASVSVASDTKRE